MSHHITVRASVAALVASTVCVVVAGCGTQVSPPAQDVGRATDRTSHKIAPVAPAVAKPSAELRAGRGDPRDTRSAKAGQKKGWDRVDRTRDWH